MAERFVVDDVVAAERSERCAQQDPNAEPRVGQLNAVPSSVAGLKRNCQAGTAILTR